MTDSNAERSRRTRAKRARTEAPIKNNVDPEKITESDTLRTKRYHNSRFIVPINRVRQIRLLWFKLNCALCKFRQMVSEKFTVI